MAAATAVRGTLSSPEDLTTQGGDGTFTTHTGIGVPLRRSNVDTDQIIPAVYLKRVTRTGLRGRPVRRVARRPVVRAQHRAVRPGLGAGGRPRLRHRQLARARRLGVDGPRVPRGDLLPLRATSSAATPRKAGLLAAQVGAAGRRAAVEAAGERAGHRGHRRPRPSARCRPPTSRCGSTSTTTPAGGCWRASTTSASPCATPTRSRRSRQRRPARLPVTTLVGARRMTRCLRNGIRPYGLQTMNKTQLIDALAARLGDRRTAASAVDGLLSTIVETVQVRGVGVAHRLRRLRSAGPRRAGRAQPAHRPDGRGARGHGAGVPARYRVQGGRRRRLERARPARRAPHPGAPKPPAAVRGARQGAAKAQRPPARRARPSNREAKAAGSEAPAAKRRRTTPRPPRPRRARRTPRRTPRPAPGRKKAKK